MAGTGATLRGSWERGHWFHSDSNKDSWDSPPLPEAAMTRAGEGAWEAGNRRQRVVGRQGEPSCLSRILTKLVPGGTARQET